MAGSLRARALMDETTCLTLFLFFLQSLNVTQNWGQTTVIPKPAPLCSLLSCEKGIIDLLLCIADIILEREWISENENLKIDGTVHFKKPAAF